MKNLPISEATLTAVLILPWLAPLLASGIVEDGETAAALTNFGAVAFAVTMLVSAATVAVLALKITR